MRCGPRASATQSRYFLDLRATHRAKRSARRWSLRELRKTQPRVQGYLASQAFSGVLMVAADHSL
jgi:hypothetical protein